MRTSMRRLRADDGSLEPPTNAGFSVGATSGICSSLYINFGVGSDFLCDPDTDICGTRAIDRVSLRLDHDGCASSFPVRNATFVSALAAALGTAAFTTVVVLAAVATLVTAASTTTEVK